MNKAQQRELQEMAKIMALHCVRNTYLETLHAELPGFTQAKMKRLMIDVANQIYTFLSLMSDEDEEVRANFFDYVNTYKPPKEWKTPVMNSEIRDTIRRWKTIKRAFGERTEPLK